MNYAPKQVAYNRTRLLRLQRMLSAQDSNIITIPLTTPLIIASRVCGRIRICLPVVPTVMIQ